MRRAITAGIALLLPLIVGSFAPTASAEVLRPELSASLQVNGDWISGVPLWVALEVVNRGAYAETLGRQRPYPFMAPTHRFEVRSLADGEVVTARAIKTGHNPLAESLRIKSGKGMRLLFQVESSEPLPPGDYELWFWLRDENDANDLAGPATAPITVRRPTPAEQVVLDSLDLMPWWFWFERGRRDELRALRVPLSLRHAVAFDLLLRRLLDSGECDRFRCDITLRDLRVEDLGIEGYDFFAPEIAAMKYEILWTGKRESEAADLRERTLRGVPGIEWLFDDIRNGTGPRPLRAGRVAQRHASGRREVERSRTERLRAKTPER